MPFILALRRPRQGFGRFRAAGKQGLVAHVLTPALESQGQEDLSEFKVSLEYKASSWPAGTAQ